MDIRPNSGCTNALCRQRQVEWAAGAAERKAAAAVAAAEAAAAEAAAGPLHESNEWGIEVTGDDAGGDSGSAAADSSAAPGGQQQLPEGIQFSMPVAQVDAEALRQEAVQATDAGVDDLMAQLEQLSA